MMRPSMKDVKHRFISLFGPIAEAHQRKNSLQTQALGRHSSFEPEQRVAETFTPSVALVAYEIVVTNLFVFILAV